MSTPQGSYYRQGAGHSTKAGRQAGTVSVRQCRLVVGMGKATNSVGFFFSKKMNDDEGKGVGMMLVITGPH